MNGHSYSHGFGRKFAVVISVMLSSLPGAVAAGLQTQVQIDLAHNTQREQKTKDTADAERAIRLVVG
jgi:hypothetical protein